jgi:membrane protein
MDNVDKSAATFPKRVYRAIQLRLATAWDLLWDTIINYQNNGDVNQAAAISFYAILSFFPLYILTFIIMGQFFGSDPAVQQEMIEGIRRFHPYYTGELLKQLGELEQKRSLLGWVGIITLVWFSSMIFGAIETAFNLIFRSKTIRNYLLSKLLGIAMIPMAWAVAMMSVIVTYIATIITQQPLLAEGLLFFPLAESFFFRAALPYLVTVVFFTIIYKIIPPVKVSFGIALTGAAIFSALLEVAKHFFTWYLSNYTRYNVMFGGLETVVIILIWVFYVALILLFCAELISSYLRRDLLLLEKAFLNPGKDRSKLDARLFRKFGHMYPKGSVIFGEGDASKDIYYILMGSVRVEKNSSQMKKVLAELGPGEYFGEMATLAEWPRTATAVAAEDSDIAVIDGDTFHRLLRENDEVAFYMLREFSNRIKHTDEILHDLSQSWLKLTVALYVFLKWPLPAELDPIDELVVYTGKSRAEIEDILKDLDEQGILNFRDGNIVGFVREAAWRLLSQRVLMQEM